MADGNQKRRRTDRDGTMTPDEWLLSQNIEMIQKQHEHSKGIRNLLLFTLAILVVTLVLLLALEIQVQRRNAQIDRISTDTEQLTKIACGFEHFLPKVSSECTAVVTVGGIKITTTTRP